MRRHASLLASRPAHGQTNGAGAAMPAGVDIGPARAGSRRRDRAPDHRAGRRPDHASFGTVLAIEGRKANPSNQAASRGRPDRQASAA
jgi:hypothetical protein